jgi:hypothetical protein
MSLMQVGGNSRLSRTLGEALQASLPQSDARTAEKASISNGF